MLEVCARVAATGAPETHQGYYSALDKWFEITCVAADRRPHARRRSRMSRDRVRTETALQRLQYSIDQMDDYPAWTDSEGRIIEVSESTCRHLEYTRDELLNMTVFDICPDVRSKSWTGLGLGMQPLAPFRLEVHHRHQERPSLPGRDHRESHGLRRPASITARSAVTSPSASSWRSLFALPSCRWNTRPT